MAIRVVRHIGGRSVDSEQAKILAAIPYGAGERPRNLRIDAFIATRANSYADQPSEVNWLVLDVPWAVLLTHTASDGASGGPDSLDTAAKWDTLFRNLALEYGTDGNEYYGADYDQTDKDVIPAPGFPTIGADNPAIEASMGPSGVLRLFSREVFMRPLLSDGSEQVRYYDEFNTRITKSAQRESGGVILIGVIRYEAEAQTNLGVEWDADRAKGLKPLIGGDMSRVQAMIGMDTTGTGDALRTMLFGGDNYIEADTVKEDPAKAYVKCWCSIETPYSMMVR